MKRLKGTHQLIRSLQGGILSDSFGWMVAGNSVRKGKEDGERDCAMIRRADRRGNRCWNGGGSVVRGSGLHAW